MPTLFLFISGYSLTAAAEDRRPGQVVPCSDPKQPCVPTPVTPTSGQLHIMQHIDCPPLWLCKADNCIFLSPLWFYTTAFLEKKEQPPLRSLFKSIPIQQTAKNSPGNVQLSAAFVSRDCTFTSAYVVPKTRQKKREQRRMRNNLNGTKMTEMMRNTKHMTATDLCDCV